MIKGIQRRKGQNVAVYKRASRAGRLNVSVGRCMIGNQVYFGAARDSEIRDKISPKS